MNAWGKIDHSKSKKDKMRLDFLQSTHTHTSTPRIKAALPSVHLQQPLSGEIFVCAPVEDISLRVLEFLLVRPAELLHLH